MLARQERRQTAKDVFENAWLQKTEIELHENVMRRGCEKNAQVLYGIDGIDGIDGMIQVLTHKLFLHHSALGTIYMKEVLEERRLVCASLGL